VFVFALKKIFALKEAKWDALFKWRSGKEMFYIVVFLPYVFMLVVMFWLGKVWFDFIHFKYSVMGSVSVIVLFTLTLIVKLPRIKRSVNHGM